MRKSKVGQVSSIKKYVPLTILTLSLILSGIGDATAYTPLAFIRDNQVGYLFWQQIRDGQSVPFYFSTLGTPDIDISPSDPAIDEFEAIQLAFQTWQQQSGVNVQFLLQPTAVNQFGYDGQNVVFFADLGNVGYGAVTLITYNNVTGQILDTDIHINDHDIRWLTSLNDANGEPLPCPCQGNDPQAIYTNDVQGLVTHEIGHTLGLDHSAVGQQASASTPTMYPFGIWNVPGDGTRPPNSRYRTLELDDKIGLQNLYPPLGRSEQTAAITGEVHDRFDQPLFGAHVVAKNTASGIEVGVMSGVLSGAYQAQSFALQGLPAGDYEIRAEPINGSPPGYVSQYSFGGINQALIPSKFPAEIDLPVMYHRFVYTAEEATQVSLAAGGVETVHFRPIAAFDRLPKLLRPPRAFPLQGNLNSELIGPLQNAELVYTIDEGTLMIVPLSVGESNFSVEVPQLPSGSLVEYRVEVQTAEGEVFQTPKSKVQVGLSSEPLVFISKTGTGKLSAVDTKTFFEVDETKNILSYPLGQAFHRGKFGIYISNFGTDRIDFIPFKKEELPPTNPTSFDTDGDGLLDGLEPVFGTNPNNPDTDGDLELDGSEISQLNFNHPDAGASFIDAVGGTVANDGATSLGGPFVNIAIFNVSTSSWASGVMTLTPSGRFQLHLPADSTYYVSFFNAETSQWILNSSNFSGSPGQTISAGVTQLTLPPPNPLPSDSGSDPLDPFDFSANFFSSQVISISLEAGADSYGMALDPDERYLYATGSGTNKVYKIDTDSNNVVGQASTGAFPKGVAVTPGGSKLYVANVNSASISVFNAGDLLNIATIPITGSPQHVTMSRDGSYALVTASNGLTDVYFINTLTDMIDQSLSSGINRGLEFLSPVQPGTNLAVGGSFAFGASQVGVIDATNLNVTALNLGPTINTTSGVGIHPYHPKGYTVNYLVPELVEFDLTNGNVLQRLPLDHTDIRNISVFDIQPDHRMPSVTFTEPSAFPYATCSSTINVQGVADEPLSEIVIGDVIGTLNNNGYTFTAFNVPVPADPDGLVVWYAVDRSGNVTRPTGLAIRRSTDCGPSGLPGRKKVLLATYHNLGH